jgi:hypothetical protein
MFEVNGNNLQWSFNWRRRLFSWEEDLVYDLKVLLEHVMVRRWMIVGGGIKTRRVFSR